MLNLDKFKTPEAKFIGTIAGITIVTSVTLQILPKSVSVALLSAGAGMTAVSYFVKQNPELFKKTSI